MANDNIRFDRQRTLTPGKHPKDKFVNYQLQANLQARNPVLAGLAAHGNGNHRARGGLGGSTLASINVQSLGQGQREITPERLGHALDHSNRTDAPIWVLDRQSNMDTVPASRRQRNAVYHEDPYNGYTSDSANDDKSPFSGADKTTGLLSNLDTRFFRPRKAAIVTVSLRMTMGMILAKAFVPTAVLVVTGQEKFVGVVIVKCNLAEYAAVFLSLS